MPESLSTVHGEALDVDRAEADFAAAMAAPPVDKPAVPAPARKPPEPAPDPVTAPHGWTWTDGEWRPKKAHGRPRATDKPRVTDAPSGTAKATQTKTDGPKGTRSTDYRKTLRET